MAILQVAFIAVLGSWLSTGTSALPRATSYPAINQPCTPSPCGPNSQCEVVGNLQAKCTCLPDQKGAPPNCRPECVANNECTKQMACINLRCRDPCPGICGSNATCTVNNYTPSCQCKEGFEGNPLIQCTPISTSRSASASNSPSECDNNLACPNQLACINKLCKDPCLGACGLNAHCFAINHSPICACASYLTGNPAVQCIPTSPESLAASARDVATECVNTPDCPAHLACINKVCKDPCPGACGLNAHCFAIDHMTICACAAGLTGDATAQCIPIPPVSRAQSARDLATECVTSLDCPNDLACINKLCRDPCPGTCGLNAHCFAMNHKPICQCTADLTGDPFTQCIPIPPKTPTPSVTDSATECVTTPECPAHLACINKLCKDPCPGVCGLDAICTVTTHVPRCTCAEGHQGDPFYQCIPIPPSTSAPPSTTAVVDPCVPFPCGDNARCTNGVCTNITEYVAVPYESCNSGCVLSSDCSAKQACLRSKCTDPCPGTCAENARCTVSNHSPVCSCLDGFRGDGFASCSQIVERAAYSPVDACYPTPCGPNALCSVRNGNAICTCLPGYFGLPPSCRPECAVSKDCPQTKACVSQKCIDPCLGVCGEGAHCEVINHRAICSCRGGQSGDPCRSCSDGPVFQDFLAGHNDPCSPSPCGANARCHHVDGGRAASCKCPDAHTGNPYLQCTSLAVSKPATEAVVHAPSAGHLDPCSPSPCGANAQCHIAGGAASCKCPDAHTGNPYLQCTPFEVSKPASEARDVHVCFNNTDCPSHLDCISQLCSNPCPGLCGDNATCTAIDHVPQCTCAEGLQGNPFIECRPIPLSTPAPPSTAAPILVTDPCVPFPCGDNARCTNGVCANITEYVAVPYASCNSGCVLSSECLPEHTCLRGKCIDPCPGTCGELARCLVVKHNPICSCPDDQTGDPFVKCRHVVSKRAALSFINPCLPSPCGPNSVCNNLNDNAVCSCMKGFLGSPPSCRPECAVSTDCPQTTTCVSQKCIDPCLGVCGEGAHCEVINHRAICSCRGGQSGDPCQSCSDGPVTQATSSTQRHQTCVINKDCPSKFACINKTCRDPCPGSCGPNATCLTPNHNPVCTCSEGHTGDPFIQCTPIPTITPAPVASKTSGCVLNSECPPELACVRSKCIDTCAGACGVNAMCNVVKHNPLCLCPDGFSGDPFVRCSKVVKRAAHSVVVDPCTPSPCGPNSQCRSINDNPICSCQKGFIGSPPSCRAECVVSADCSVDKACLNQKCLDPCAGVCGQGARCTVDKHNPICRCPEGKTGDPFRGCSDH